jgi:hypothetical protein
MNNTGKKFGGRTVGTPNKLTKEIREVFKALMVEQMEAIPGLLNSIDNPEKKLDFLIKLLPFILPKVENVSISADEPNEWD